MSELIENVRATIEAALPGSTVEIETFGDGPDHLSATVRAPQFAGLSRIEQHRLVNAAVRGQFDDGSIHALALKTIPTEEVEAL